jgi:hypothetical protein
LSVVGTMRSVHVLPLICICAPRRIFPVVADATFPSAGPNFYQTERPALKQTLSGCRKECGAVAGPHIFPLRPSPRRLWPNDVEQPRRLVQDSCPPNLSTDDNPKLVAIPACILPCKECQVCEYGVPSRYRRSMINVQFGSHRSKG